MLHSLALLGVTHKEEQQNNYFAVRIMKLDASCPNERITIYAPMIYTAPCVIVLMRADTLCGKVGGGGLGLEIESFWAP
jgi:hypothetical protein